MTPTAFVAALSSIALENVFNPYLNQCPVHDLPDAAKNRRETLLALLNAATQLEVDSVWVGRDLGYRGGRRTGLALTDEIHLGTHAERWQVSANRVTRGLPVAERTAAVVWSVLSNITSNIFLWNVFPLHPHEPDEQFSNRAHNALEGRLGESILTELIKMLQPQRIVAIGNDAVQVAQHVATHQDVIQVRHPSYGGQATFLRQITSLYCCE